VININTTCIITLGKKGSNAPCASPWLRPWCTDKILGAHHALLGYSQNLRVLRYVGDEIKAEWGKHWIEKGFNGMFMLGMITHIM
jgi:hypothetical protein